MAQNTVTVTITLLTKEQAEAGTRSAAGKASGRRRSGQRYHGRPAVPGTREALALLTTRPQGHAAIHHLHIEPWIPVKDHSSVASVVAELRERYPKTLHIPDTSRTPGIAMAYYSGRWHRIMMLDGRVHIRRLRGAWGLAQKGYMPCDCCYFRTDSRELHPVAAGKTNASLQEYHVCIHCLNEGVLARTSAAGYIVKRME